ncbi:MAG: desulfoferrodoxin [Desulfobacteraceae bacterium]|nr:MAG: desulfoferrodoxin [Desulfobacteraceae bacterium]
MPEKREVYRCEACGNIVEVLEGGGADLVCCGEEMLLLEEKTADEGKEKHVPIVGVVNETDILVRVGSNPHPMEEKHYIQWIDAFDGKDSHRHYLKPGQDPETVFQNMGSQVKVREYCNLHGLWSA